jgi:hypothetical protein
MKRESLGWVVAGIVAVLVCTLGAMQREGQVGRYQLVEGRFHIIEPGKVTEFATVWRIDTVTGDVVSYHEVSLGDEKDSSGWLRVDDFKE